MNGTLESNPVATGVCSVVVLPVASGMVDTFLERLVL